MWWIALTDSQILCHLYIPKINPTWSLCKSFKRWIWFARILWRILKSVFIRLCSPAGWCHWLDSAEAGLPPGIGRSTGWAPLLGDVSVWDPWWSRVSSFTWRWVGLQSRWGHRLCSVTGQGCGLGPPPAGGSLPCSAPSTAGSAGGCLGSWFGLPCRRGWKLCSAAGAASLVLCLSWAPGWASQLPKVSGWACGSGRAGGYV